jgi:DNA-binding beta-propeller fold protein YncE
MVFGPFVPYGSRKNIGDIGMSCKDIFLGSAMAAGLMVVAAQAQPAPSYSISKTVPIGAPDRWDYVVFDPLENRVYASHGDRVSVVDGGSGTSIGTISLGEGAVSHGVVALDDLGKGYTDDGKAGVAVVFDLKTLKVLHTVKAEPDADGIVYDHKSGHVLVITGDSGKVVVIDPETDKVLGEIDGGGPLEFGVSDEKGKFYVDGEDKNEIVRMDLATNKADAHWPLTGCKTPHGLAIDRAHMRLFASCGSKVMDVMNAQTGQVIASLPIGQGTDFDTFYPAKDLAFSSNRDGTLSVLAERSPDKFEALTPIKSKFGARTMALDEKTGRIFLISSDVTENNAVPVTDRNHFKVVPGSAEIIFLDPK